MSFANQQQNNINNSILATFQTHLPSSHQHQPGQTVQLQGPPSSSSNTSQNLLNPNQGLQQTQQNNSSINSGILPYSQQPTNLIMGQSSMQTQQLAQQSQIDKSQSNKYGQNQIPAYSSGQNSRTPYLMMINQSNIPQNMLGQQQQHNQQTLSASSQSSQNYSTNTHVGLSTSQNQQQQSQQQLINSQNTQQNLISQPLQQQQANINSNNPVNVQSIINQQAQQSLQSSSSAQVQSQPKNAINHNHMNGNMINSSILNSVVSNINSTQNQKNSSLSNSSNISNINQQQGNLNGNNPVSNGSNNSQTGKGQSFNGNGSVSHQMNDIQLCKQNLICFTCDRNICEDCIDHNKGHISLSIDKIYEQSFSNVISNCQKPYLSCIDSIQKNEKAFQKFQEVTKDLIDGAFHNFKIAEAYNSRDFKIFGQIFRKHYQIDQNAEAIQVYKEKPESISNIKGTLEKQLEKAYERLINFISSINQITNDEINQISENLLSSSIPIQNVFGAPTSSSQTDIFQINNMANSQNSSHLPPTQQSQISQNLSQIQIHGQNYFNIPGGQQLYDQHFNFTQGVPNNQNPYMFIQSLPYGRQYGGQHPQINMHNQHIGKLNTNQQIANQQRPVQILQNGITENNESNFGDQKNSQKNNLNNVVDIGPTKKHLSNPKSQQIGSGNTVPLNSSQGLSASHISQNNYSTYTKQQPQHQNASSSGIAQSHFSSEDSLPTQNEGQGAGGLIVETNELNNKQVKHFSSENMKQEAIETSSKTSSHQNIQIPQQLSIQQKQMTNQIESITPTNAAIRSSANSIQTIIPPSNKIDPPPNQQDESKEQINAKNKPKKPHQQDATKLKAYQDFIHENLNYKQLSKKYDVVEGTIKKWIQYIKEKIQNNELEDNYEAQKLLDTKNLGQNEIDKIDHQQLAFNFNYAKGPLTDQDLKYMRETYGCTDNSIQPNQISTQINEKYKNFNQSRIEQDKDDKQYLKREDVEDNISDAESSKSRENNSKVKNIEDNSEIDIENSQDESINDEQMQEESHLKSDNSDNLNHKENEECQKQKQNIKKQIKKQKGKSIKQQEMIDKSKKKNYLNQTTDVSDIRDLQQKLLNQKQLKIQLKNEHDEVYQDQRQMSINKNKEDNSQSQNQISNQDDEINYKNQSTKNSSSPLKKKQTISDQYQQQIEQNKSNEDLTPTRKMNKKLQSKDQIIDSRQMKYDSENEDRSQTPNIFVEESYEKQQNQNIGQNQNSRKILGSPHLQQFQQEQQIDNTNGDTFINDVCQEEETPQKHDEYGEMRLICFPLLDKYEEIPLETTIFALSKDNIIQLKYSIDSEKTYNQICEKEFEGSIKELKFQIFKSESIIFIHLEDGSLYMWRWQQKQSDVLLIEQKVQNFDTFVYSNNLFIVIQKGDNIQVRTIDKKLVSNLENIKPQEESMAENCSIQNLVAWGNEENQQWYICCNSGNCLWAYSLDIEEKYLENSNILTSFKIQYESFSDQQELIKIRLHRNQKLQQEVIGACESGQLYIFDILNKQRYFFTTKNQGERQMKDIQVKHPYNCQQINDEPKIILCYENFIRIRKHKKLQFGQPMCCAAHEVKNFEINVYYVLNNSDTILKHSINYNP